MTDAITHEWPRGRQHPLTLHLPSPQRAPAAPCFVCLVNVPPHIPCQGHALTVGCLFCSSPRCMRAPRPAFGPPARVLNRFLDHYFKHRLRTCRCCLFCLCDITLTPTPSQLPPLKFRKETNPQRDLSHITSATLRKGSQVLCEHLQSKCFYKVSLKIPTGKNTPARAATPPLHHPPPHPVTL